MINELVLAALFGRLCLDSWKKWATFYQASTPLALQLPKQRPPKAAKTNAYCHPSMHRKSKIQLVFICTRKIKQRYLQLIGAYRERFLKFMLIGHYLTPMCSFPIVYTKNCVADCAPDVLLKTRDKTLLLNKQEPPLGCTFRTAYNNPNSATLERSF